MTDAPKIERVLALPAKERLAIAEAIWESLVGTPDAIPVPEWHTELLAERLAAEKEDPRLGEPWPNVRRRIEKRG